MTGFFGEMNIVAPVCVIATQFNTIDRVRSFLLILLHIHPSSQNEHPGVPGVTTV